MTLKILFVEDDELFRETFIDSLTDEGYDVSGADSSETAMSKLKEEPGWDLFILDERLRGSSGPMMAANIARKIKRQLPEAHILIVTAYETPESVQQGFDAGIDDYLLKGSTAFEVMLKIKVRQVADLVRATKHLSTSARRREEEIRRAWAEAQDPALTKQRRGRALEELLARLLSSIPGFLSVRTNVSNNIEEIDVVVRNESPDIFWQKFDRYLFVECKNWSKPVERREVDILRAKIDRHTSLASMGILIAMGGYTDPAREEMRNLQRSGVWIVGLTREDVQRMIDAPDRSEWLKGRLDEALLPR